jgi:hypothetical protein
VASLQARHQRSCPLYPWTPFEKATKKNGCKCRPGPLYHTHHRVDGKVIREVVGHNRKEAERILDALRGDVARHRYRVIEEIAFRVWADRWLAGFTGKANSKRVYATTLAYAKAVFGNRKVRDLGAGDVRRLLDHIRDEDRRRRARSKDEGVRKGELSRHAREAPAPARRLP